MDVYSEIETETKTSVTPDSGGEKLSEGMGSVLTDSNLVLTLFLRKKKVHRPVYILRIVRYQESSSILKSFFLLVMCLSIYL